MEHEMVLKTEFFFLQLCCFWGAAQMRLFYGNNLPDKLSMDSSRF